ncbi:MAG: hypothetical protein WC471_02415 [Candidatus Woesearchaeota archaeon]
MNSRTKIITTILLFLALILSANAFEYSVQALQDSINTDQQAMFLLTINNDMANNQDYRLSFGDVGLWEQYYTDPLSDYFSGINNVKPKQPYTTKVILKPIADIGIGYHTVNVLIEEVSTGRQDTAKLPVYIRKIDETDKEYLPTIVVNAQMDKRIDPRKDNIIRLVLLNKNRRNLTNVEVRFESNIFKKTLKTSIEPLEQTILEIPMGLDPLQPPEKDTLYITVGVDKYNFKPSPIQYEIIDYSSQFLLEREELGTFLKTTDRRSYINDGNIPRSEQIKILCGWFSGIFRSTVPEPDAIIEENDNRYCAWNVQLAPGEEFNLDIIISYRILFYILAIGILGYFMYQKFRSPVVITKQAKNVEMREGGISEVKILLSIRNISEHPVEHLSVVEKIPNIANITEDFDVGTIRPSKVLRHAGKGSTIVEWEVDELDAHEDRLIVYRIKSRLSILGRFTLPLAMIKFSTKTGKIHKVFSNRLTIGK